MPRKRDKERDFQGKQAKLARILPKPKSQTKQTRAKRQATVAGLEAAKKSVIEDAWAAPEHALVLTDMTQQEMLREKQLLGQTVIEEKRELGKADFWFFFTRVLFPLTWHLYYLELFHRPIASILQRMLGKPGSNQMFILPREHRKTFLVLVGFVIWLIVRDPNIRIMLIGAKEKTVGKWATLIRDAFVEGNTQFQEFQKVFPDFVIPKRGATLLQATQFTHPLRTKAVADPTLFATYLGVTGAGGRADVQIFDDPYERRNVSNPVQSAKALSQTLDLFPLVEVAETAEYRLRIFNATRWAYHDPIGTLLGEKHEEQEELDVELPPFQAMVRHAFEDPDRPCEQCPDHVVQQYPHGHPDMEKGEPILFPIITREALEARYREYCADVNKGESLYYHQYQNVCLAPSDQKFKDEWFIQAHYPIWPTHRRRVLCVDSADKDFQQEGTGDYMVALFGEFDDFGRLMLVHGIRSNKWTRDQFIRKIIVWCSATNWFPHAVAKEKFGGDTFLTDLSRAFREIDRFVHALPVTRPSTATTNYMKKLDWIVECLQGPLERAEIVYGSKFPSDLFERSRYEHCNLGQVKNEDVADCKALFMAKGVRVEAHQQHRGAVEEAKPPNLSLYSPGMPTPPPIEVAMDPVQQALQSRSFQAVAQELPMINQGPRDEELLENLTIKLDEF